MRPWFSLSLLVACGELESIPPADSAAPLTGALAEVDCAASPDVTWDNWAGGKLETHCQGCHASQTPDRYGAPDAVAFDTEADARRWRDRIYQRTLVSEEMPPAGGLTDDDKYLLTVFLACGL